MRQHSGALQRKWNRQFTRPIFSGGREKCGLETRLDTAEGVRRLSSNAGRFEDKNVDWCLLSPLAEPTALVSLLSVPTLGCWPSAVPTLELQLFYLLGACLAHAVRR